MIAADSRIGMTSSGANHAGWASTSASSASTRNPTARWAIGEILTMTGAVGLAGELTRPSSHRAEVRFV